MAIVSIFNTHFRTDLITISQIGASNRTARELESEFDHNKKCDEQGPQPDKTLRRLFLSWCRVFLSKCKEFVNFPAYAHSTAGLKKWKFSHKEANNNFISADDVFIYLAWHFCEAMCVTRHNVHIFSYDQERNQICVGKFFLPNPDFSKTNTISSKTFHNVYSK